MEAQTFFLYGEPPRAAGAGFLHLESLGVRSRQNGWSIRLHRHTELNHVFLLSNGGGEILTAAQSIRFEAPCLLFIPAGEAHGFVFQRESVGHVLTIASQFLERRPSCGEAVNELFEEMRAIGCSGVLDPLQAAFTDLSRELGWLAPGHAAAVEALLLQIFVLALRLQHQTRAIAAGEVGRERALLARFREQVELRFRNHEPLEAYAQALECSLSRLHRACRRSARLTPLEIIQSRIVLEAKRALLYSDMRIADIAIDLGFSDPAYFSRFFAHHTGGSAQAFRSSCVTLA